ncbi:MAG: peptidylprolyl isomerase [Pseudomonadota bacterium]
MTMIKDGDTVFIHYTGTLTDGTEFDSSKGRDPLEFTVGSGMVIAGLDRAMAGMALGEKKRVEVACADGYGPINPDNRLAVPRDQLPEDIPVEVGLMLQMQGPEGQAVPVTVVEVSETEVTLDANHMLAGKDLIFDIEVVSIKAD